MCWLCKEKLYQYFNIRIHFIYVYSFLTGNIAKRAQRVIVAGKREVENTDDPEYVAEVHFLTSSSLMNNKTQPTHGTP